MQTLTSSRNLRIIKARFTQARVQWVCKRTQTSENRKKWHRKINANIYLNDKVIKALGKLRELNARTFLHDKRLNTFLNLLKTSLLRREEKSTSFQKLIHIMLISRSALNFDFERVWLSNFFFLQLWKKKRDKNKAFDRNRGKKGHQLNRRCSNSKNVKVSHLFDKKVFFCA